MSQPLIQIKNATVYRGRTRVFSKLNLEIRRYQHSAILGPNGAGKSTFLQLLSGTVRAVYSVDSEVRVLGREKWNVWELRTQLGIVSHDMQQHYAPEASGLHVVLSGYYASVNTWPHQKYDAVHIRRASDVMHSLGCVHLRDKTFAEMSTGEQRRLLLARALVNRPHTLVLDEPTSGLDVPATMHYLELMRDLMRDNKHTVVLVTHHIHEIPPQIKRVVLLRQGAVLADGARSEIMNERNLSALYGVRLKLVQHHGFYQVLPAG